MRATNPKPENRWLSASPSDAGQSLPAKLSPASTSAISYGSSFNFFEPASRNTGTLAPAGGKKQAKKAKKAAKPAERPSHGYNILQYLKPPPGGRSDQENSPPNSPLKRQMESQSTDNNKDIVDLSCEIDVVDMTGWQCPFTDCHEMNSSTFCLCKGCGRHTSKENLKLIEAMTFV